MIHSKIQLYILIVYWGVNLCSSKNQVIFTPGFAHSVTLDYSYIRHCIILHNAFIWQLDTTFFALLGEMALSQWNAHVDLPLPVGPMIPFIPGLNRALQQINNHHVLVLLFNCIVIYSFFEGCFVDTCGFGVANRKQTVDSERVGLIWGYLFTNLGWNKVIVSFKKQTLIIFCLVVHPA